MIFMENTFLISYIFQTGQTKRNKTNVKKESNYLDINFKAKNIELL